MDSRILNVIAEDGTALYEATRQEIHEKGLLHAEVHVWFYTPDGRILFQHRAKDKDTYPDLLDATVGGHVEIGDTYEQTALKEAEEETGTRISPKDLVFLRTTITSSYDEVTGMTNHSRRNVYAYCYRGRLEELRVEEGKAEGFEAWRIERLMDIPREEAARFIPSVFTESGKEMLAQIRDLV